MTEWSLPTLLESLHDDIHQRLEISRKAFGHPSTKGDASEEVWLQLFDLYLPKRYEAAKGFVVDNEGKFSEQIDIIIFDRQYSPFIFNYEGQKIIPAESVYAVFEAKQTLNAEYIDYTDKKVQSVKALVRTSLPIPHAGGTYPAKVPHEILGGVLTFESDWSPALGIALNTALNKALNLCLGCVAAHGYFYKDLTAAGNYQVVTGGKPATSFLFKLISELQLKATVPMIDVLSYSRWLSTT